MKSRVFLERFEFENGDVARVSVYIDDDKLGHIVRRALANKKGRAVQGGGAFIVEAQDLGNVNGK